MQTAKRLNTEVQLQGKLSVICSNLRLFAGDCMATHNGQKFSTFGKDQKLYAEGNCAKSYLGAFVTVSTIILTLMEYTCGDVMVPITSLEMCGTPGMSMVMVLSTNQTCVFTKLFIKYIEEYRNYTVCW